MTNYVPIEPSTASYVLAACWLVSLLVILALSWLGRRRTPGELSVRSGPRRERPVREATAENPRPLSMRRTPEERRAQLAAMHEQRLARRAELARQAAERRQARARKDGA